MLFYKANLDMKGFHQEVVRVVLLDSQLRCITKVEISKGTVNASFTCPREIFRPPITHSSFGFALVHNHPSGSVSPSDADLRLTKRIASGARILQIKFLDHVIVGQALAGRPPGLLQFPGSRTFVTPEQKQSKAVDIKRFGRPEENGSFQGNSCLSTRAATPNPGGSVIRISRGRSGPACRR